MPSVETDLDNERREVWTEWIMERKYFHEIPTLEGRPGNAFFVPNSKNRSDQIFERGEESEVLPMSSPSENTNSDQSFPVESDPSESGVSYWKGVW
jgi:hypothetical protein